VTFSANGDPSPASSASTCGRQRRDQPGTLFGGLTFLGSSSTQAYAGALTAGSGNTYRIGGGGGTLSLNTTLSGAGNSVRWVRSTTAWRRRASP